MIHAFGDSIPTGAGATPAAKGFVSLLSADLGAPINNGAVSTAMAVDQFEQLNARTIVAGDKTVVMVGTNDQACYDVSLTKRGFYIDALRSFGMRCAAEYKEAQPGYGVTFTGTWGTGFAWGCYGATAAGAKATFQTSGPVALLEFLRQKNNTSSFRVKIDGVDKGTFLSGGDVTTLLNRSYGPQCIAFSGLGAGLHTVEVTAMSADASNVVFFKAFSSAVPKAKLVLVNIPHAIAYTYGGNQANVDQYNASIAGLVAELSGYGLDVSVVDACSFLAATDMADNVHPNNTGHLKIRTAVYQALTGSPAPVLLTETKVFQGSDGFLYAGSPPVRIA